MNENENIKPLFNNCSLFIVIPYYNESEVIGDVLHDILANCPDARIVIVDDGSERQILQNQLNSNIVCLRHCCNLGQGAALQTGITYSLGEGADFIITFDADGQHQASDIFPMIEPLLNKKFDIVFGSRFLGGSEEVPLLRKLAIRSVLFFHWVLTGVKLSDYHNGFRAMNRKAAKTIKISQNRMAHATEILQQVLDYKLSWTEIPVHIRYTTYSRKKGQKLIDSLKIITDLLLKK